MKTKIVIFTIVTSIFATLCAVSVLMQRANIREQHFKNSSSTWGSRALLANKYLPSPFEAVVLMKGLGDSDDIDLMAKSLGENRAKVPQLYFKLRQHGIELQKAFRSFSLEFLELFEIWATLAWSGKGDEFLKRYANSSESISVTNDASFVKILNSGYGSSEKECSLLLVEKAFRLMQIDETLMPYAKNYLKGCEAKDLFPFPKGYLASLD